MNSHKDLYLISFGTSSTYRYYADHENPIKLDIADDIKKYLEEKFPDCSALKFLETPQIKRVEPEDEAKYVSYPVLDKKYLDNIEAHLEREHKVKDETEALNLNAPFSNT